MPQSAKKDNDNLASKLALRKHGLARFAAVAGVAELRVFDACRGHGVIWDALRMEIKLQSYVGFDVADRPGAIRLDSLRAIGRLCTGCNVYDVDTYGQPWRHLHALLGAPAVAGPVLVFCTCRQCTFMGTPGKARFDYQLYGIPWRTPPRMAFAVYGDVVQTFAQVVSKSGWWSFVEAWESTAGLHARYLGAILKRKETAA